MMSNNDHGAGDHPDTGEYDVVIVGAGIAGIYMLHKARQLGFSAKVFEKGSGPGGTWYWNRYPGAQCDVPSMQYSYSFDHELEQEWEWTDRYARQPEIERYLNHVVDRFELRDGMRFDTTVEHATWNADDHRWVLRTDRGDEVRGKYAIMATGGYHVWLEPGIPGLDTFKGELYYTTHWPHEEISFAGKRVGVIGTGSSGVQTAKAIAQQPVESLHVFQRTAPYVVPSHDEPLDPEYVREFKRTYRERRARARRTGYGLDVDSSPVGAGSTAGLPEEEFQRRAEFMWQLGGTAAQTIFPDYVVDEAANNRVGEFIREKIRETVQDPELAEQLCPYGHYLGAKRIVIVDDYFEIYNKPNVHLVDIKSSPIHAVSATGVITDDAEYPLDMVILATGFDSATGSMLAIDIRGENGVSLRDVWANGHHTFLGIGIPCFPNMFMIAQAGSPGIRSHVMVSAEQHVDWIGDFLVRLRDHAVVATRPTDQAAERWTEHVAEVAATTLLTVDDTQHLGSNVPGKPRVVTSYLGGVATYRDLCDAVADDGYTGWILTREDGSAIPNELTWEPPGSVDWLQRDQRVGQTANVI